MADIFTPEKRSWVMSRIRGTNTKIDLRMKEELKKKKIRFEMYPKMFGNPDFKTIKKDISNQLDLLEKNTMEYDEVGNI